jgi:hypothetical protein
MRLYVLTLTGACLFLFFCPPAHGQTSSKAPCGDPQKAAEDKDSIGIVELGAATNWNLSGGAATDSASHQAKPKKEKPMMDPKIMARVSFKSVSPRGFTSIRQSEELRVAPLRQSSRQVHPSTRLVHRQTSAQASQPISGDQSAS